MRHETSRASAHTVITHSSFTRDCETPCVPMRVFRQIYVNLNLSIIESRNARRINIVRGQSSLNLTVFTPILSQFTAFYHILSHLNRFRNLSHLTVSHLICSHLTVPHHKLSALLHLHLTYSHQYHTTHCISHHHKAHTSLYPITVCCSSLYLVTHTVCRNSLQLTNPTVLAGTTRPALRCGDLPISPPPAGRRGEGGRWGGGEQRSANLPCGIRTGDQSGHRDRKLSQRR